MTTDGFLPFTASGKATELRAIEVKRTLGLGRYAGVDPFIILPRVPARLVDVAVFDARPDIKTILFDTHREDWSAIGLGVSPATGEELILLNDTHHDHRQKASLMEEIVHVVLGHPRTKLALPALGEKWVRPYDEDVEDEAYCVGAACIIPWPELFDAVSKRSETVADIAGRHHVSTQYVEYRIRRAGLDRVYKARQRVPARR